MWLLLGVTLFAGAASPGPSLALVLRSTVSAGRHAGVLVALAHGIGVWLYALAVVFGVAAVLLHMPSLMLAVQLGGVVFLLYLGAQMMRGGLAASENNPEDTADPASVRSSGRHLLDGFLIVFLNPKIMVFFLAVFSQVLTPQPSIETQVLAASRAGFVYGLWYGMVAVMVSLGSFGAFMRRHRGKIDLFFGAALWVTSLLILSRLVTDGPGL